MGCRRRPPMVRLLLFALLALPIFASAQMVRGTVSDASTGAPVKAVNLTVFTIDGQRLGRVLCDDDGKFEIVLPKGKTVYVQAARIGYETVQSEPISASTSELLELNVRLSAAPVPLQGIEVAARRQADPRLQPFLDRASLYKRSGIGHIWTRKELERRPLALVSVEYLRNWVPRRRIFNCDGISVFLDDLPVDSGDVASLVAPEDLEGVEMYNDLEVPPDLLMRSRSVAEGQARVALATEKAAAVQTQLANAAATPADTTAASAAAGTLPPCESIMLWRKPYAELTARVPGRPFRLWRALIGAAALGMLFVLEYSL